jgi:ABC-type transport system involved in multi-copper enzyme maturation permease subunit
VSRRVIAVRPDTKASPGKLIRAETLWMRRRLAFRIACAAGAAIVIVFIVLRFVSSDGDLAASVALAEGELARMEAELGEDAGLTVADVYVERRYIAAAQLPVDLAGVGVVLALVGMVLAGTSSGSEWRTGTVRLSFADYRSRALPTFSRIGLWGILWFVGSLILLSFLAAGLCGVAAWRGLPGGVNGPETLGLLIRSSLLCGCGAAIGVGVATAFRSDALFLICLLSYVLGFETLWPALALNSSVTPSAHLIQFVMARHSEPTGLLACEAPVCPELFKGGAWDTAVLLAVLALTVLICGIAILRSRRPLWR